MITEIKNLSSILLVLEENFAVSVIDREGKLTYVNQKLCDMTKYSSEELIGQMYSMLNPSILGSRTAYETNLGLLPNEISQSTIRVLAKDGTPYWVQSTIVPILDEKDQIIQYLSFEIDVSKIIVAEQKYEKAIEDLHNIENALSQSTVIAITNQKGVITSVNEKFCKLSQYSPDELIGQTHRIVNSGFHPKEFFKEMWRTIGTGKIWRGEVKNRAKDGSEYWVDTTIVPFLKDNGKPYQYISIRTDITSKKEAERSLEIALRNDFRQTVKNLQNAIFKYTYDANGNIILTLLEGKIVEKLGITIENITLKHTFSEERISKLDGHLRAALRGQEVQFEIEFSEYTFLVYLSPIYENVNIIEVVGTAIDISERKETEKVIEHMAYYDYLTQLPNRRLFQKKVNETIIQSKEEEITFAIMFIDLDRFKNVNDSMGHSTGDQLLRLVGERLKESVRKDDIVSRHGGDEYAILLPSATPSEAEKIAERIIEDLTRPFSFNNIEVFVSSSIGISIYPNDGTNYETLTGHADSAMYLSKESGKNNFQFFTKSLHQEIIEKAILERELRKALKKEQFTLHYQPQINLNSGKLTGLEALIRWHHPSKGLISPADFIPIAEETSLIGLIGQWVLETACRQVKKWQDEGLAPIQISVNVSIQQFKQASFVEQVKSILKKTKLEAKFLNLEITESMTSDVHNCQTTLQELRVAGINVSIDDFGTGYSSLSYLSKFPITHLKIDRIFVKELTKSNRAIVKTIISLAKNLDINVIAEGVETEEQAHFLKELNCDEVQGYFYSKPLASDQIKSLLTRTAF